MTAESTKQPRLLLRVKPKNYQPTRTEPNERIRLNATPEPAAGAVMTSVRTVEGPDT